MGVATDQKFLSIHIFRVMGFDLEIADLIVIIIDTIG